MKDAYYKKVGQEGLQEDPEQQRIVDALHRLQCDLGRQPGVASKILRVLNLGGSGTSTRGIYLWGGVGRGKTFLMDLFFNTLDIPKKRRIHFHRMMREVHERLKAVDDVENPLDQVAAGIAKETRVLCFDEFYVNDIGDAMVLGRLLEGLFARGVILVTTSNSPPDRLYPGGLQRDRFLPAIDLLNTHTTVIEMDSGIDYRLRVLQQAATFLTPAGTDANVRLQKFFQRIAPGETVANKTIDVLGRSIGTLQCGKGIAWFNFDEICDGPRSQNDYIEIARWYQTVIISDLPVFDADKDNQARRFISLVDEFYDRRVKLIASANAGIDELYQGTKLKFEFQRTASRLTEMQSEEYLHEAHLA